MADWISPAVKIMAEDQAVINRRQTALERSIPGYHVLIAPAARARRPAHEGPTTEAGKQANAMKFKNGLPAIARSKAMAKGRDDR